MNTLEQPEAYVDKMLGNSPKMQQLLAQIRKVAVVDVPYCWWARKAREEALRLVSFTSSVLDIETLSLRSTATSLPRMLLSAHSLMQAASFSIRLTPFRCDAGNPGALFR